jgi:GNAT superfamily N-acetyltransferase
MLGPPGLGDNGYVSTRELKPEETASAYAAMLELRPQVGSLEAFLERVAAQRRDGYRLVASFEDGEEDAAAVAGFRTGESLAWGRFLYVDDLATRADRRRRGHGGALMRWLADEAERLGCDQLHLDSGLQRRDAHRLYLASGMRVTGHHFARPVGSEEDAT